MKSKGKVTELLWAAQLEILHLSQNRGMVIRNPNKTSLKFSWNAIVMEITGADVDITFIDLPEIIYNPPKVLLFKRNEIQLTVYREKIESRSND
jgi:hypothetical protein